MTMSVTWQPCDKLSSPFPLFVLGIMLVPALDTQQSLFFLSKGVTVLIHEWCCFSRTCINCPLSLYIHGMLNKSYNHSFGDGDGGEGTYEFLKSVSVHFSVHIFHLF